MRAYFCKIIFAAFVVFAAAETKAGLIDISPIEDTSVYDRNKDGIADTVANWARNEVYIVTGLNIKTILEFDISSILSPVSVSHATLTVGESTDRGTNGVNLFGYSGNGDVYLDDWTRTDTLITSFISNGISNEVVQFDVTAMLQSLLNNNHTYAGFVFAGYQTPNATIWTTHADNSNLNLTQPSLSISYAQVIAEPSILILFTLVLVAFGYTRNKL